MDNFFIFSSQNITNKTEQEEEVASRAPLLFTLVRASAQHGYAFEIGLYLELLYYSLSRYKQTLLTSSLLQLHIW
jgi:hypothetical protein